MVDQDEDETEATAGVNHVNSSGQGVAKAQCQLLPRCKQKKAARVQAGRTETLPRLVDHGHRLLLFAESSDQSPAKRQLSPPPSGGPNQGPVGERPPTSSVMHPHSPGLLQSAPLHYCHCLMLSYKCKFIAPCPHPRGTNLCRPQWGIFWNQMDDCHHINLLVVAWDL